MLDFSRGIVAKIVWFPYLQFSMVVLTFPSSILSRFVSPLLIFPTALSGSSVEVPPCRAIGSQNRFHHVPQCAQGKDFSRVTERVPPIFRSADDNGISAGVSEMRHATLLLLLSRPSPSLRVWTMVCVRTEFAARNSRPAVSQDMGVLVVTSWDG